MGSGFTKRSYETADFLGVRNILFRSSSISPTAKVLMRLYYIHLYIKCE